VEGLARRVDEGALDESVLADSLYARYTVQEALARIVPRAVEFLGGLNFMTSDEVGYLAACANGLALHPPSRSLMAVSGGAQPRRSCTVPDPPYAVSQDTVPGHERQRRRHGAAHRIAGDGEPGAVRRRGRAVPSDPVDDCLVLRPWDPRPSPGRRTGTIPPVP